MRRQSIYANLLQDGLRFFLFAMVTGAVIAAVTIPASISPLWLDWPLRALLAVATALLLLAILREIIPAPVVGSHIVGPNAAYVRWLVSSAFADFAMHPVVRCLFWPLHGTRVLYLKALGTRIGWSAGVHEQVVIREPSMVAIGAGAQLEPGVTLEASLHGVGRIRIAPILIGGGCRVGAHAILMPGATLGHDATVAPGVFLGENVHVGVGAKIGERACIERNVDLGSYATVGTGAVLSEGVRVGDRARIAAGAVVEANTEIGERELWDGVPARRVSPATRIAAI